MRLRSLLYVPADNARFLARAGQRGADALILDLEDGVAEDRKDIARAALARAIPALAGTRVFVRVNAGPDRLHSDVAASLAAGAHGIVLPKVRAADDMAWALPDTVPVIALIEDPAALLAAPAIAAHPAVIALALGSEDFAAALGARPLPEVLRLPMQLVHYAAKAHGRLSLGLFRPISEIADAGAILAAATEARLFGFDGAACIHPAAVPQLNLGFSPDAAEVAEARAILAAFSSGGAVRLGLRMIDKPVADRARRILWLAENSGK